MSCCGKKRAEFSARRAPAEPTSAPETEPVPRAAPARTFEYTGSGVLTVKGVASGAIYRFGQGDRRVEVAYEDAFAMMAEPDLRPVSFRRDVDLS
jgi:hypothetical protein